MNEKEELNALDRRAEAIMEQDGLSELDPDSIISKFEAPNGLAAAYDRENILLCAAKLKEAPRQGAADRELDLNPVRNNGEKINEEPDKQLDQQIV